MSENLDWPGTNWCGNVDYTPAQLARPRSVEELQRLVAASRSIRGAGSGHTFNAIADAEVMVTTADLGGRIELEGDRVWVSAHTRYADLCPLLDEAGWALPALASLPHISVAGSVATGTHGTGDRTGNLATQVTALELVTASGDLLHLDSDHPDFAGSVVNVGALGVVTRLQLQLEPRFDVAQRVFTGLSWEVLENHFDEITSAATAVSLFTLYGDVVEEVWLKQRLDRGPLATELFDAPAATETLHPIVGLAPDNVTEQLGVPGPWYTRWPHFIPEKAPASGKEIQSEFFVRRDRAVEAIAAMRRLRPVLAEVLMISEIRTIAADDLWLSPAQGQDVVALHFTWQPRPGAIVPVLAQVEQALAPLAPRVHWGKLLVDDRGIADRFPLAGQFRELAARLDPEGKFVNPWFTRVFG
ncbi:FAD-binding protein [Aestuariimicrobium kwangyangense]|uniref:FAD-binding protein n=1 Tax=Aestuariimicrobium kwangyangense TaxID=396389 RepID=UPI0003B3EC97|nr:FAD-binding protein [Aestuariimicrobium kwangyangense]